MSKQLKLALADDHKMVTDSLSVFLTRNLPCSISFIAKNGNELLQKLTSKNADILILDINMPEMDGLEALKSIKTKNPAQKVLVMSMYNDEVLLMKLVKLRVNGFLSKSVSGKELLRAIHEVQERGHYFTERMIEAVYLNANEDENRKKIEFYAELDETDLSIMRMICKEYSTKEMADELCLSVRSIEGRRKRMLKKIGVKNQAGIIIYAIKHGIASI